MYISTNLNGEEAYKVLRKQVESTDSQLRDLISLFLWRHCNIQPIKKQT